MLVERRCYQVRDDFHVVNHKTSRKKLIGVTTSTGKCVLNANQKAEYTVIYINELKTCDKEQHSKKYSALIKILLYELFFESVQMTRFIRMNQTFQRNTLTLTAICTNKATRHRYLA